MRHLWFPPVAATLAFGITTIFSAGTSKKLAEAMLADIYTKLQREEALGIREVEPITLRALISR